MNSQFDQAQQLATLWLDAMAKMMTAGMQAATSGADRPPPHAARHLRDVSLDALG